LEEFKTSSCAVNPSVDYRDEDLPKMAEVSRTILVVGGGVAGMEFARTVAKRGHHVSLYEKTDKLGGNLLPAGNHSFKKDLHRLAEWYERELSDVGVEIHKNTEVNPSCIAEVNPDVVVLATGSVPVVPRVNGVEKAVGCLDVLNDQKELGQSVVVVGGGLVGCEIAYDLAVKGKNVTIVEGLDQVLTGNVPYPNKMFLLDSFEKFGTKIITGAMLKEVTDQGAVVEKGGESIEIPADDVVISIGFKPGPSMAEEISALGYEVVEVGDGASVGNVMTSIWSAFDAAKVI
ncbi:MAG: FAD-dependent oxidoreductase, partial [Solobacterium sp.]|nr:FAD-dependent oxidoreductase [Solobacterium sp.]